MGSVELHDGMMTMKRLLLLSLLLLAGCTPAIASPPVRIVAEFPDGTKQAYVPEEVTPDPDDPDPPAPPVARTNIGINLAPHRYYSSERPFVNLAKGLSTWQWSTSTAWAGGVKGTTDANGYPQTFPTGVYAGAILDLKAGHPNGEYFFTPSTLTIDGQIRPGVVAKTKPEQRFLIRARSPISSLSIKEASNQETGDFAQQFVDRTRQFGTIRTMDWNLTNEDRPITWQGRVTKSWFTQADREVAIEHQIDLAVLCDANLWFCVHHRADDDWVRQCAKLFKQQWPGKRTLYLEHSNEVWNGGFPQYRYCVDRSPSGIPLEYHIQRTAAIVRIFRSEGVECVGVLGAQSVAVDHFNWALRQLKLDKLPGEIDMVAIAPYFGYQIVNKASVDAILAECAASIQQIAGHITAWKATCDRLGVTLGAYEAGQHLALHPSEYSNTAFVNNYIAANRDARMYDLYRSYLAQWDRLTNRSVVCLFNSVYQPSQFGSWGLLEHESQPIEAPKYRAVVEHMRGAP
jgi:hypothetical protein